MLYKHAQSQHINKCVTSTYYYVMYVLCLWYTHDHNHIQLAYFNACIVILGQCVNFPYFEIWILIFDQSKFAVKENSGRDKCILIDSSSYPVQSTSAEHHCTIANAGCDNTD